MTDPLDSPTAWEPLDACARRGTIREGLEAELGSHPAVLEVLVSSGTRERPYDLQAGVRTEVGVLYTDLWSQARAALYEDASVHPASREKFAPAGAIREAADRLRERLEVRYELGRRGLEVRQSLGSNVIRTWTIEKPVLRGGARIVREDRIQDPGSADLRELMASLYTGPSLRAVGGGDDEPFFIPAASDTSEGEWISLCRACESWTPGSAGRCEKCDAQADVRLAMRPPGD